MAEPEFAAPTATGADVGAALSTLDPSWTVYSSPRIGFDRPDFLAVHDRFGVCIIDILDWTPETTCLLSDGQLGQLGPDNVWAPIELDPRVRAARSRSAIFDQFWAMPEHGDAPTSSIRSVIILPAFTSAAAGALFPRADDDRLSLIGISGGDAVNSVIADVVTGFGCQAPASASIEKLRRHVAAAPVSPDRRSWDPSMPQSIVDIAENLAQRRHRRVEGAAGSGKSSAVAARAARLASEGKHVLALSFNVTFANGLRSMVDGYCSQLGTDPTLVVCANFHSFCTRVVSDAEMAGALLDSTRGVPWTVGIVEKATQAYREGHGPRFDAVMVDEGQDFTDLWWSFLNDNVLVEGGETLLTADRTQDIYARTEWLDDVSGIDAVGVETITLPTSLRLPADVLALTNEFASSNLDGTLQLGLESIEHESANAPGSVLRWGDVTRVNDIGAAVGQEVVELLQADPTLRPADIAFVCDYHHDGVRAAAVIERAGIPVHHIFSRDPDDPRRRRKHRFWTDADAVKGCTAHSLKGWDVPAVVLGIGADARAKRLAYVAMTRARRVANRQTIVSVVNADPSLRPFGERFVAGSAGFATAAPVPTAEQPTPAPVAEPVAHVAPASPVAPPPPAAPAPPAAPVPPVAPAASVPAPPAPPVPAPPAAPAPPVAPAPPAQVPPVPPVPPPPVAPAPPVPAPPVPPLAAAVPPPPAPLPTLAPSPASVPPPPN